MFGGRQSKTTVMTHCEKVIVSQFAEANPRIAAGDDPLFDTTNTENDSEMNKEAKERKFHRMAKVHNILEMWEYRQNLSATWKESCTQHKQITAVRHISDTAEIVEPSWSHFQHEGAAAFKM